MENPNQIAYQKLLKRINEAVKDVNVFIELIELAHDVRILSYEQGVSDIKQVYGITPPYTNHINHTKNIVMKSKITRCCINTYSNSEIEVTNHDGTTAVFGTPSIGKDHDTLYTELRTLADAYIAAFAERTPTYHVTSVAHIEDNVTIVEPSKNAA